MIRKCFVLSLIVLLSGCATAIQQRQDIVLEGQKLKEKFKIESKIQGIVDETIFLKKVPEYERLVYKIKYLGMTIGTMTATNKGLIKYKGKDAYHFEATAQTAPFFSKVFKIDNRMVSYMDAEKLHSLRYEVYRREGNYKKDAIVEFDQINNKAYYTKLNSDKRLILDVPPDVKDPLAINYYTRMMPWSVGDTVDLKVYVNEKVYDVLGLIKPTKYIKIPNFGKRKVYQFQPYATLDGENIKESRGTGYFAADDLKLPLMGIAKTPIFGKASIVLDRAEYAQSVN